MFDQAQLRKGTLEGCILQIISREPTYGYAIAATLRDSGFSAVTEGTLYPLLLRLERKGLIAAEYRAGSGGPSRKYLWVLSRTPTMPRVQFDAIRERALRRGYPVDRLLISPNGVSSD